LILLMKRRIGGYTGDCCGACFLLCELSFYLSISALWN
ncbi:MAG: adenosylcobinamide-GDP ribazoletransferase, partial [Muribaculaceae bacterium]|nr:adenosylcobinamide-GDP ribazoletransferase [Muribaculaceae bacterium]